MRRLLVLVSFLFPLCASAQTPIELSVDATTSQEKYLLAHLFFPVKPGR